MSGLDKMIMRERRKIKMREKKVLVSEEEVELVR